MSRIADLAVGLLILTAGAAIPAGVPAAAPSACDAVQGLYARAGQDAAAFQQDLEPADYEVGVGAATYGPGPGPAVPWPQVAAWVQDHPSQSLLACGVDQGWVLAELRVRGGYAYVMLSPAGRVAKFYLSTTPMTWD